MLKKRFKKLKTKIKCNLLVKLASLRKENQRLRDIIEVQKEDSRYYIDEINNYKRELRLLKLQLKGEK